jgi:hypothetical protein
MTKTTLSGRPPALPDSAPAPQYLDDTGLYGDYWVLDAATRARGFVRPVRHVYRHDRCGLTTRMAPAIAETFAADPKFYEVTFCSHCRVHDPVGAFHWPDDGSAVGT